MTVESSVVALVVALVVAVAFDVHDPMSAPNHRCAMIRSPALLARGGFHPQAIHGLWVKSSASCLDPRLRAGLFAADSDARRSQTGKNVKSGEAKANNKAARGGMHCASPTLPGYP